MSDSDSKEGQLQDASLNSIIWTDPERMGGQPCFYGTRVPVKILFDYIEGGQSLDEFLSGFPSVTRDQAEAVIEAGGLFIHQFRSLRERLISKGQKDYTDDDIFEIVS
ncbi:MAG: DUF433 domain-containing protein [Acidobacteriota bacterium]|nr:MAG: DUF433 domain-containing protein [Acidobacteriota bacterium]